jgi:hypothetical protein
MAQNTYLLNQAYARDYAKKGMYILPLHGIVDGRCTCGNHVCKNPGKHPVAQLVPNGLKNATADPDIVNEWFTGTTPWNIGIATGKVSDIWVIDIDIKDGKTGDKELEELERRYGRLPKTATVITGSGGKHYYYRYPLIGEDQKIRSVNGALAPGLDIKGDGGYVVAPPSIHISGKTYEFSTNDAYVTYPPLWLVKP